MRHPLFLSAVFILLFAASCSHDQRSEEDRAFEQLADRFVEQYLSEHPEDATALGDHRYDSLLTDFSAGAIAARTASIRSWLDTLRAIHVETLSTQDMIDCDILRNALERELFALVELREWQWNPLMYSVGDALYALIARDNTPLEARMRYLSGRMRAIPSVLRAARNNLEAPPALHTQTAILQNGETISLLTATLEPLLAKLPAALGDSVRAARTVALDALHAYGYWLKRDLITRSTGDFRLGRERYERKFALQLHTSILPDELLAEAERRVASTTVQMYGTARQLYPKYFPDAVVPEDTVTCIRAVLNRIAARHPDDSTVVDRCREGLHRAESFVREHRLVTLPDAPLQIIVMPEYMRGAAVAYCDAPGQLDRNGVTFLAIAPTPADWTAQRKESFYREYNDDMLLDLIVHEAIPGHYVQLAAARMTSSPTQLRGIFPSAVFAEGWATYAEDLMVAEGFGGPELKMEQLKMYLRILINSIIDQEIHTAGMTESEAMALMTQRGFQEESEAAAKWRRACLTSVQLSTYLVGNLAMRDIRARAEQKAGSGFDLRAFHDDLLSYGTIAPGYFPVLMKLPTSRPSVVLR